VLLKHYDEQGLTWYTDSRSQKGQELAANPHAALLFHWRDLNRQIRISGKVEQLPAQAADKYFYSRPQGSRYSAAVSHQSSVIDNIGMLDVEIDKLHRLYPDGEVPRPQAWVGYRLAPQCFEFWQGQVSRLHDRIRYLKQGQHWSIDRLSP